MYNPQLETFLCVAEAGSFNKAAEKMYVSPPAVIKQMNLLEDSLGVRLFERTHRGLALTKAGQSLAQDARYIIQYCKDSVTRAKNAMQESESVIRIGASPMTPAQVLVELWPALQAECPNIKFQIVPFENTPENAREILANLGQTIDVVAGIFDETMLKLRKCAGLRLSRLGHELLDGAVELLEGFAVPVLNGVRHAVLDVVLQDNLRGVVQRGAHGGELNEHLGAVAPALYHFFHGLKVPDGAREAVQHRLGLCVRVGVGVHLPVRSDVRMGVGVFVHVSLSVVFCLLLYPKRPGNASFRGASDNLTGKCTCLTAIECSYPVKGGARQC